MAKPQSWDELRLLGIPRGLIEPVSARLFALGAVGAQEDYLPGTAPPPRQPWDTGPPPPQPKRQLLRAWFEAADRAALERALSDVDAEIGWEVVREEDWGRRWQDAFVPIRISDTLTIAPPWNAPPGALIIEPGQGFGTGQHPTTRMALVAMERHAPSSGRALDVGCGSGVLALAAARRGFEAHGIDIEAPAVSDALRNAERNGLTLTASTQPLQQLAGTWDLVFGNLHAELIHHLSADLVRVTSGVLILAGILADREDVARQAIEAHMRPLDGADPAPLARLQDGEWVGLVYQIERDTRP